VDNRRWISGDGSRETDDNQSPFLYEATKLQSSADMQAYDIPAAWLHRVRYRALFRALFKDTELCSLSRSSNAEYDPESDPESHSYNADAAHHEAI